MRWPRLLHSPSSNRSDRFPKLWLPTPNGMSCTWKSGVCLWAVVQTEERKWKKRGKQDRRRWLYHGQGVNTKWKYLKRDVQIYSLAAFLTYSLTLGNFSQAPQKTPPHHFILLLPLEYYFHNCSYCSSESIQKSYLRKSTQICTNKD